MNFDSQPTLEGSLLKLRPLRADDFEPLFSVASDPLIWELHPNRDRYKREVFEGFFFAAMDSKGALVAVDAETGDIIGSSRYSGFDPEEACVEVGYTFRARSYWGRGHNREMKDLMLGHAFRFVKSVLFYVGENNLRSRRAVEKLGATLVDRVERIPAGGTTTNISVVYRLERPRISS